MHRNLIKDMGLLFLCYQLDILVNNAGRSQRAWAIETELAVDVEMIQLNVIGQVSLTKCVLPHMVERGKGHVIITSSLASKTGIAAILKT